MFIQTEETPNPNTRKFLPGQVVMLEGTRFFQHEDEATLCPLATQLLVLEGIEAIFFGADFISVTKTQDTSWMTLSPFVFAALVDHFLSDKPLFLEEGGRLQSASSLEGVEKDPISQEIADLLDSRIRPAVARDGGDIIFNRFEDGVVYVHLQGACAGCPSSTATLKAGIENMLRHYVPEVEEVRAI